MVLATGVFSLSVPLRLRLVTAVRTAPATPAAAMAQDLPLQSFALARFDRWNAPSEPLTLHG